jgi:hypothetical protein
MEQLRLMAGQDQWFVHCHLFRISEIGNHMGREHSSARSQSESHGKAAGPIEHRANLTVEFNQLRRFTQRRVDQGSAIFSGGAEAAAGGAIHGGGGEGTKY